MWVYTRGMKKQTIIIISILGLGLVGWVGFMLSKKTVVEEVGCTMEAKICPDGSAVGRSGPKCEFAPCPEVPVESDDIIRVTLPQPNDTIQSPVKVQGEARGTWYFEASFPISVVDGNGVMLGQGIAQAKGEWMTTEFVPFEATIEFTSPQTATGSVVFSKDNPSGLPENDASIAVPVRFGEEVKAKVSSGMAAPIDRAKERVTKKPFGIYIDSATSPVQPERFVGFHTGTDFETFADEAKTDVEVRAICDGTIQDKRTASGYGGLLVTSCTIDGQAVTVVYGHLKLSSIEKGRGEKVVAGEDIGVLGEGGSRETDGERKHLHLGIHKGSAINILGYTLQQKNLSEWLDPCVYVCQSVSGNE